MHNNAEVVALQAVEAENAYRVAVLETKQRKEAVDKVKVSWSIAIPYQLIKCN